MTYTESHIIEHDGDPNYIKLLYISEETDMETCNSICFTKSIFKDDDAILVIPHLDEDGAFFAFGNEGRLKIARWMLPEGFEIAKVDK